MPDARQNDWVRNTLGVAVGSAPAVAAGAPSDQDGVVARGQTAGAAAAKDQGALRAATVEFAAASGLFDAEIKRLARAGLDTRPYDVQAEVLRGAFAEAMHMKTNAERAAATTKIARITKTLAADAKKDVDRVTASAVEGIDKAVAELRDGAATLIAKLPQDSEDKPMLAKRLQRLDAAIAAVDKVANRADRAHRLKQLNVAAESLFNDAAAAAKDDGAAQVVYAAALKSRYGIEISTPENMKQLHLPAVYKMFDKVPDAVVEGDFKTLAYDPAETGEAYKYENATIVMGPLADDATDDGYVDPTTGNKMALNVVGMYTLHELGHAVGRRFRVMEAFGARPSAGGWHLETAATVARLLTDRLHINDSDKRIPESKLDYEHLVSVAIEGYLSHRELEAPDGLSEEGRRRLAKFIGEECAALVVENDPWEQVHDFGGRSYHQSYETQWVSYETAARTMKKITVSAYQWRSPLEWFAELYAFTWFNSKPPPAAVEPAIAAYLYGGDASDTAAPSAKP